MNAIPPPPPHPPSISHECVISAAAYYNLPPELLVAIRLQENGKVGVVTRHPNGARDIGPMQINEQHLRMFARYGISKSALTNDECANLFAGAYILSSEIRAAGSDIWKGVGNYHSHTPKFHFSYRASVAAKLQRLQSQYGPYVAWLRTEAGFVRMSYIRKGVIRISTP